LKRCFQPPLGGCCLAEQKAESFFTLCARRTQEKLRCIGVARSFAAGCTLFLPQNLMTFLVIVISIEATLMN